MQELVNDPEMRIEDDSIWGNSSPGEVSWSGNAFEKSRGALRAKLNDGETCTINIASLQDGGETYRYSYEISGYQLGYIQLTGSVSFSGDDPEVQIGEHTVDVKLPAGWVNSAFPEISSYAADGDPTKLCVIERFSVMALAYEEQILSAITTLVTGLTTTTTNVFRGRAYPLEAADLPGLLVYMGPDQPVQDLMESSIDWHLGVGIECYAKSATAVLDTTLALIRKEVHAAIMATPRLGLSFVIDTWPVLAAEPEITGEGSQPVGRRRLEFMVHYRTSRADISA